MAGVLDRLVSGSPLFEVERAEEGYVLVADPLHHEEFTQMVRDLLNHDTDEFVVLPVTDGNRGYDRAVILPIQPLNSPF